MKFSWKSRKPAYGLAALTVSATVVLVGAGPTQAAPVSLTLNYNCPFPLIGDQVLAVKIDTNLPDDAVAGASSTPITSTSTSPSRRPPPRATGKVSDAAVTEVDTGAGTAKLIASVELVVAPEGGDAVTKRNRFQAGHGGRRGSRSPVSRW